MAETELTVRVLSSYKKAKEILSKNGYAILREVLMEDDYLTNDNNTSILRENVAKMVAGSILIRRLTNEDGDSKSFAVYKDKTYDNNGNVIEEEKTQVLIESPEKLKKILTKFGFRSWANVKTMLHVFTNDSREVCLQEVEGLGLFFEYEEDISHKGLLPAEKIAVMQNEMQALGLNLGSDYFVKKLELLVDNRCQAEEE